ncbi:MAG: biopolymer transporter ExbD [Bacteroidetes bacterium]|nr:biopolymer transporter ExbD [Bacteroidota bacterium]
MAEMDTSSGGGHKKGPGVKKPTKKSTRVDLTPMVDLGFLLITFFVFTTTMQQPTAMKMAVPKDNQDNKTEVKQSGAMTILLGKGDQVYYYYGQLTNPTEQFKATNFTKIRAEILNKKKSTPPGDLMIVIKPNEDATFKNVVDIFDEMTINDVKGGHFALDKITPDENKLVHVTEQSNGIK